MTEKEPITITLDKLMRKLVQRGYRFYPTGNRVKLPSSDAPVTLEEFELIVVRMLNREVDIQKLKRAVFRASKYQPEILQVVDMHRKSS